MNIKDFETPTKHPFGMLKKYKKALEKESFLAWFLIQCIEKKDLFATITTRNNEDHMAYLGLLEKVGDNSYCLTDKSIGLLYSAYGKPEVSGKGE